MKLDKGLSIEKGYLKLQIQYQGLTHKKWFGKATPEALTFAKEYLSRCRREILMGVFNPAKPTVLPRRKLIDIANDYFDFWKNEKDPAGAQKHDQYNISELRREIDKVWASLHKLWFDDIRPKRIQKWREDLLATGLSGSSANRYQAALSGCFDWAIKAVKLETIPAFQLPKDPESGTAINPCVYVERAAIVTRDRIATEYEIRKLLWAAKELGDLNGLENICLALETCTVNEKDLQKYRFGDIVNIRRSKTGKAILIPITIWYIPNWVNWRKRWEAIRAKAGIDDLTWRDIRKSGGNLIKEDFDMKSVGEYMGHANEKTTEGFYMVAKQKRMGEIASKLISKVDALRPNSIQEK